MAGSPVKQAVLSAIRARAVSELSDDASALDFACDFVSRGGRIADLAKQLGEAIGRPVSRPFVSGILHNLSEDASARLEAARSESAAALVEEAAQIADGAEPFPASVAKAGLQVKTRHWMAERFAPEKFGPKSPNINIVNTGTLMLDALRQPLDVLMPTRAESADEHDAA
jgi:hypothetical protein